MREPKINPKSTSQIPGNLGLPWIGETLELFKKEQLFFYEHFKRYGPVFKTRIMGQKLVVLVGPDANRYVLVEQDANVSSSFGWSFLKPLFGRGLLLQDGVEHLRTRRLLKPAFHSQAVGHYLDVIEKTAENFLRVLDQQHLFPLLGEFRKLTLLIASRLFLGCQTPGEVQQTSQWFNELAAGRLALLRVNLPWTTHGRALQARLHLQAFLKEVIHLRKRHSAEKYQDVLGLLLATEDEQGRRLSESEIIDQALLLLFAGHDTTATLLSWLVYELGVHTDWQERLREELNQVAGKEPITLSHFKQLVQMSYVLMEAERLYPPIYSIPRGLPKGLNYSGYEIPPGWKVHLSPFLTHRMPGIYPQPHTFDPNRFAPPREEHKKHSFALMGFGAGPHKCLGHELAQIEIKVILSILLRRFRWSALTNSYVETPTLKLSKAIKGLQVKLDRYS